MSIINLSERRGQTRAQQVVILARKNASIRNHSAAPSPIPVAAGAMTTPPVHGAASPAEVCTAVIAHPSTREGDA